jgi:beta-N-acetylhexosaminidase
MVEAADEELAADLEPFRTLRHAPMGMTAHVVYRAWDGARPASLSPAVIGGVIRGRIGFEGFLMSDDIGMSALSCGFGERARGVVEAGCDAALHCSGEMAEMAAVAAAVGELGEAARGRLARAMAGVAAAQGAGYEELAAKRDSLLAHA